MSTEYTIRNVADDKTMQDALAVRRVVFIEEQQVPEDLEIDEHDKPDGETLHAVAYRDNQPVATGRVRTYDTGVGKVERVAVLESERGTGIGKKIMLHLEEQAKQRGFELLKLNAQCHAQVFYEKLGYEPFGEVFDEAGIDHIAMKKNI
ncbi:GNAT family N-acetyltransferase [Brevibacillus dissolubilis]|uniref:GNAT family N-acetyltransferase n=1 Tax=Brevibacillus dissolubilis TaxID=1844116 RepID=UPI00159BEC69|nr:GNAT family N-acetyltransferase [Brevibacillus dissolubilis]